MKTKKPATKRKSTLSVNTTIIVAIIGFFGTVVAALVGLWGINLQRKQPLLATQTPQTESLISNNQSFFAGVLDVIISPDCGTPDVMPDYIYPFQDANKALIDLNDIYLRGDYLPAAPAAHFDLTSNKYILDGSIVYFITVTSKATDQWIKFANKVKITINSKKTAESLVNTFDDSACGGGSIFRDFSLDDNSLDTKYPSYTLNATYQDVDFFTLEPGEFEILTFSFQCGKPGLYQLQFEIPVEYQGETGSITASAGEFLCPSQAAYWVGALPFPSDPNSGLIQLQGMYKWSGSQYTWGEP